MRGYAKRKVKATPGGSIPFGKGTVSDGRVNLQNENIGAGLNQSNWKGMSFKKGGNVPKTGLALVHKGEKVIPKDKVAKYKSPAVMGKVKKAASKMFGR